MALAPGSKVRLNSGSPSLTVVSINGDDVTVTKEATVSDPSPEEMTFKIETLTEEVEGEQAEQQPPAKRILVGLGPCRFMNYVMANGALRPFLVVDARDETGEAIDGILFFNGRADSRNHPVPLRNDDSGHLPTHSVNLQGVVYDADGEKPGTVHWPARQPVMAASVDPAALSPTLMAILEPIVERIQKNLSDVVNEKLDANVDTVNKLMESHSNAMLEILSDAKQPVLGAGAQSNQTGSQGASLAEGVNEGAMTQAATSTGLAPAQAVDATKAETPQAGS